MIEQTAHWFHKLMGHPEQKRLRESLWQRYYHQKLRYHINRFRCEHYQRHKLSGRGYGLLPEREMRIAPWEEVAINLIGPWQVKVNGRKVEFNTPNCINTASNLAELIWVDNKTSSHICSKFDQAWLARYPRPTRWVHDNGGDFIGRSSQWLL